MGINVHSIKPIVCLPIFRSVSTERWPVLEEDHGQNEVSNTTLTMVSTKP